MAKGRKTGGRQLGSLNKATVEVRAVCNALVDDPEYRRNLAERLRAGKLAPAVECLMWYYAKGKPPDAVSVTGSDREPLEIIVTTPWGDTKANDDRSGGA